MANDNKLIGCVQSSPVKSSLLFSNLFFSPPTDFWKSSDTEPLSVWSGKQPSCLSRYSSQLFPYWRLLSGTAVPPHFDYINEHKCVPHLLWSLECCAAPRHSLMIFFFLFSPNRSAKTGVNNRGHLSLGLINSYTRTYDLRDRRNKKKNVRKPFIFFSYLINHFWNLCFFLPHVPPTSRAGITSWFMYHLAPPPSLILNFSPPTFHLVHVSHQTAFISPAHTSLLTNWIRVWLHRGRKKKKKKNLPLYISVQSGTDVSCPYLSIWGQPCHASEVQLCQQGWKIPKEAGLGAVR